MFSSKFTRCPFNWQFIARKTRSGVLKLLQPFAPLYFVTVSPQIRLKVVVGFKTTIVCRRFSVTGVCIVSKSFSASNSVFSVFPVALQTTRSMSRAQVRDNAVEFLKGRWNTLADRRHRPIFVWWSDAESLNGGICWTVKNQS